MPEPDQLKQCQKRGDYLAAAAISLEQLREVQPPCLAQAPADERMNSGVSTTRWRLFQSSST